MVKQTFNVLRWNFNKDMIEYYNVLPYLRSKIDESIKKEKNGEDYYLKPPRTMDDFKSFVQNVSRHQFWSRCEHEMIIHGWPVEKNNYKIDVHEQIMMNINVIAGILFDEYWDRVDEESFDDLHNS